MISNQAITLAFTGPVYQTIRYLYRNFLSNQKFVYNFHKFNKYDLYGTLHVLYDPILNLFKHHIKEKPCLKGLNSPIHIYIYIYIYNTKE